MTNEDLKDLLEIPMETRMDAERVLFALEQEPDGFNTTTWSVASSVLGDTHNNDSSYLLALDFAVRTLARNHGLLLDSRHHDFMPEGLPFDLDFYVWHRGNAASNGKFEAEFAREGRNYRDANDETVADAISDILDKALPPYAVPIELLFDRYAVPMLDAEVFAISCEFWLNNLMFDLSFSLDTGKGSNRIFLGFEPQVSVSDTSLTCEGVGPDGSPFESTWNPVTAEWSKPLPLG